MGTQEGAVCLPSLRGKIHPGLGLSDPRASWIPRSTHVAADSTHWPPTHFNIHLCSGSESPGDNHVV